MTAIYLYGFVYDLVMHCVSHILDIPIPVLFVTLENDEFCCSFHLSIEVYLKFSHSFILQRTATRCLMLKNNDGKCDHDQMRNVYLTNSVKSSNKHYFVELGFFCSHFNKRTVSISDNLIFKHGAHTHRSVHTKHYTSCVLICYK